MQPFNPLVHNQSSELTVQGRGVTVIPAYQLVFVQNATAVEHSHKTRRVRPCPLLPLTPRENFMEALCAIVANHKGYKEQVAATSGIQDRNFLASSSLAFRFGEIRLYDERAVDASKPTRVEQINPSLFFVGHLSTIQVQLDALNHQRDKNTRTLTRTDTWKKNLAENVLWSFARAGVDAVAETVRKSYSVLPVIVDTMRRVHIPLEGDGIIAPNSGRVVWWLNNYVELSASGKDPAYRADQTFMQRGGMDQSGIRTISPPHFVQGINVWPPSV